MKGFYNNSIANILVNDKTVKAFSLRSRTMQGWPLSLLFNMVRAQQTKAGEWKKFYEDQKM